MHDGFFTTDAVTDPIQLPDRAPNVTIMHPQADDVFPRAGPLRLWGMADVGGADVPEDAYVWRIDGEIVAEGSDVWVDPPEPGTHEVALEVTAADRTVSERVTVTVAQNEADHTL